MRRIAKIILNSVLPGSDGHREMMPEGRSLRMFEAQQNPLHSSVLLLLFPENESIRIVFIKRAEYDGIHSGQIAFPGGRWEENDADFSQTAIRETIEETGIALPITVLGHLSDLYVPPSHYLIHPFVGFVPKRPVFIPDSHEVREVFDEDLSWFIKPESRGTHCYKSDTQTRTAPCFVSGKHTIWGATAMILNEFLVLLLKNGYFNNRTV